MKRLTLILGILVAFTACMAKGTHLKRTTCTATQKASFDRMFNDIPYCGATSELHDLIVIKNGKIIYERYDPSHSPEVKHVLWSASKTFTATAIGFAVNEGLLSVQDKVIRFFTKDELPAVISDTLQNLTVWNLLTMSSGFALDKIGELESLDEGYGLKEILKGNYLFYPGTRFRYNSTNTYLLSVIITKLTGQTLSQYLKPRLFDPLGIKDFYWKESRQGYSMGGWGLYLKPEDFSKMGLWMLQKGMWNGKQLLNKSWFDEAMSVQISQSVGLGLSPEEIAFKASTDDWRAGYCYQMWHCSIPAVRLDGAWGQFSIVCPEKNAVITLNALTTNTAKLLKYVWKNVYEQL